MEKEIISELHDKGFVIVKNVLTNQQCDELIALYDAGDTYRKTISMERYRFGLGEYKYFKYPLPNLITQLRETVYAQIAPVANQWMQELSIDKQFPAQHKDMLQLCRDNNQIHPTVLILKYGVNGFNTLHQDLYGEHAFPLQVAVLLSQPDEDFTGGEFVLTEQRPRMQSRVSVVPLRRGDGVVFAVHHRPVRGTKGIYRVNLRHGVSTVRTGRRHTLGLIFHDAE